ncbi:Hydantoinase B/oxoprolinase [Pseudarthrobacter chlorophenolicus A6]|uniref:Hydantoinase B/oxoprolinase n=1 Tax=Pseudarthrobacter chlorophenolicus (strain ATCC 700700 / DSM 12829 / CIP 107037 / JCM 12360 / KCTC 9906 / NCIMB 13794 / A6) TaxID=452863 RepID=B8H8G5_PSECP|nr:hydantoinase B/oxoprolinase family protein [Pseudarthrobacter chlorophenolicus]ACL38139.1 Hydantoinase B/oxoprolinase [Pseudarthrobacter chlorophenolicus A6]SDQ54606.1 N-methylhydantoinase B [Pseudarthrobacter chlorophenolicus]
MTREFDPVKLSVLANAFDGIVREMTSGLLRSARSSVINTARDFSCAVLTADNQLLAAAEGVPVHVFGAGPLGEDMVELHKDIREGDAFLHNDPYMGNSHAADHVILVPIFIQGRHLFTAVTKAHQADCGNSLPTTFFATARDVYEEGALIFPCVRIQRDYTDIDDIIRMCRSRIRVPDQWYGDYLASVGASRIAERRIHELAEKFGVDDLVDFVDAWFDYSERLTASAIEKLPEYVLHGSSAHDPFPGTGPEGVQLQATLEVKPKQGKVVIDLRDNPDNLPNGLNLTKATATGAALAGILSGIPENLPSNAGTFRRVEVLLRDGCAVGVPKHPYSCSSGTTNLADRVVNIVQAAFSQIDDGYGTAEGAAGQAPAKSVISGTDERNGNPYVNQILVGGVGGPATPYVDGWPTYQRPVCGALLYHDSVEVDEQRYPILVHERALVADTGGAGRQRGGLATRVTMEPRGESVTLTYGIEGKINPPKGVRGGHDGAEPSAWVEDVKTGERREIPVVGRYDLQSGEKVVSITPGGGGYGDPLERDVLAVLDDYRESRVTLEAAAAHYGVVITDGAIDEAATAKTREERLAG